VGDLCIHLIFKGYFFIIKLMNYKNILFLSGIFIFFVFLFFFSSIINLVTDWWWFKELGKTDVFIKPLLIKVIIFLSVSFFSAIFLLLNFLISLRSKHSWTAILPESLFGQPISVESRNLKKIGIVASVLFSLFFGLVFSTRWQELLKFLFPTSFYQYDPVFKKDIAFYFFTLPFFDVLLGVLNTIIFISVLITAAIYFIKGSFNVGGFLSKLGSAELKVKSKEYIKSDARVHLGILIFLLFLVNATNTYLSLFKLLFSQNGPVFGASYTDVTLKIPIIKIYFAINLFVSVVVLFWGLSGKIVPLMISFSFYFIVSFILSLVPTIFQKLVVAPNELVKETPYIKHNITATRNAYGLNKIEKRDISAEKPITAVDIAENQLTIKNVRLWDRDPLLSTFSQIQEIRTYYEFVSVDNDRYLINDEIRQIMLSPRELSSDSLPNRSWINEKLIFTHGYGLAAAPVNQVTKEGLPVLFVKDLPPKSEFEELKIKRPQIYFGELTNEYVIVKTRLKEFDYPKGEENVYNRYEGKGGVVIDSFIKRLIFALRFQSLKLLLSNDITSESRILYFRNIRERVKKITPFLDLDRDPYVVIADGKIYWIFDAYTKSDRYPYSQPVIFNGERINYIRNSVKIVIDAYDGLVYYYIADNNDPIIKTYSKIFPTLFQPLSKMPKKIFSHIRYPEDIFRIQTSVYATYHMDNPRIFYNKEDQWEIPVVDVGGETADTGEPMGPRHMIMKLPGEKKEEYILMLPFTPKNKDNLSAWMVARNDGKNYGQIIVYRFPKQKLVFGPKQVISRINQDAEISRQISLWDQRGSQVIQGPLLVIPIEESLIYVRALYLKAQSGKIPELKRVIVAYENRIAMEETLEGALSKIFGFSATKLTEEESKEDFVKKDSGQELEDILRRAQDLYNQAISSQKEGDWARYGESIRQLGEILKIR